ncbi:MAG TPA: cupin domain-containing protein [Actinomycetota bacterium]
MTTDHATPAGPGATFSLRVADLVLDESELDPTTVEAGTPAVHEALLWASEDGTILRGVWEITEGVVTDVEQDELFVVVAGRATVEVEDGPTLELAPGDLGVLAKGARTRWTVHEPLRKVFQITLAD